HGLERSPRVTALRARIPAPIITDGFDVLVQLVMAAITTSPWSRSKLRPSTVTGTAACGRSMVPAPACGGGSWGVPTASGWCPGAPLAGGSVAGLDWATASACGSACPAPVVAGRLSAVVHVPL